MEREDILIIVGFILIGFAFGVAASYIMIEVQSAPVPESPPPCVGEVYTPGTCGVDSGMTFVQCNQTNTTGGK